MRAGFFTYNEPLIFAWQMHVCRFNILYCLLSMDQLLNTPKAKRTHQKSRTFSLATPNHSIYIYIYSIQYIYRFPEWIQHPETMIFHQKKTNKTTPPLPKGFIACMACLFSDFKGFPKALSGSTSWICRWYLVELPKRMRFCSYFPLKIWVFPKIWVPQNGWFIMENPIKWMICGYPYFRKHPFHSPQTTQMTRFSFFLTAQCHISSQFWPLLQDILTLNILNFAQEFWRKENWRRNSTRTLMSTNPNNTTSLANDVSFFS